ncbi:Os05g0406700, partial [Oryza sativa Japonica Group]
VSLFFLPLSFPFPFHGPPQNASAASESPMAHRTPSAPSGQACTAPGTRCRSLPGHQCKNTHIQDCRTSKTESIFYLNSFFFLFWLKLFQLLLKFDFELSMMCLHIYR